MSKINKILDGNYIDIKCNYLRDNVYYLSFILDNKKEYYFKYSYGNDYILYYNKKEYPNNLILDNIIKCCKAFDEVIKKYENEYELVICGKKEEKVFYYKKIDSITYSIFMPSEYHKPFNVINFHAFINGLYERLELDPIYQSALNNKDRNLCLRMKDVYYGITRDEEKELTNISKIRYIRRINSNDKKINDIYYVDKNTISEEHYNILKNSGILILHRPYFAMAKDGGCTHDYYEVRPKTFYMVDAAPKNKKNLAISFDEYLKILR